MVPFADPIGLKLSLLSELIYAIMHIVINTVDIGLVYRLHTLLRKRKTAGLNWGRQAQLHACHSFKCIQ